MGGYMCLCCKTKKQDGDKYYSVMDTDGLFLACCSQPCAEEMKKRVTQKAKDLLNLVESQNIEVDVW